MTTTEVREDCGHKVAMGLARCPTCRTNERYWLDPEFRSRSLAAMKARYYERRAREGGADRAAYYKRKHGITPEVFESICAAQGNKCAICGVSREEKRLVLDHDHLTGAQREALCDRCNLGLHWIESDYLRLAIEYLDKHHGANHE